MALANVLFLNEAVMMIPTAIKSRKAQIGL